MHYRKQDWLVPQLPYSSPTRQKWDSSCCDNCSSKDKRLRSIERIMQQRIEARIACRGEIETYLNGELRECDWSDQDKRELIAELKEAQQKKSK